MPAKLTAVLGACKRRGRWQVSNQTTAFVLFGHCYIDYREAYADDELEKMKLKVTCVLGNATFIVPEGADIQPSVVSLLASTGFDVPEIDGEPPLPTLVIESTTLLGRCRVLTTPPGEEEELELSEPEQPDVGSRESEPERTALAADPTADEILAAIARVDQIGSGSATPLPAVSMDVEAPSDDELAPLEAVAKALLAEPAETTSPDPSAVEPDGETTAQLPKTEVETPSEAPTADAA